MHTSGRFQCTLPFFIVALLVWGLMPPVAQAQFMSSAPTLDGTCSDTGYSAGSSGWSMGWDDTYLYVCKTGGGTSDALMLYLDVDPLSGVITDGANSDGSLAGETAFGANFSNLPFRADVRVFYQVSSGVLEWKDDNGSGGWGSANTTAGQIDGGNSGSNREFRLQWSALGAISSRPSSFLWLGFYNSNTGFVFDELPADLPSGNIGGSATANNYFTVQATASGSATSPFADESFETRAGVTIGSSKTFHDVTNNSSSTLNIEDGGGTSTVQVDGTLISEGEVQINGDETLQMNDGSTLQLNAGSFIDDNSSGTGLSYQSGSTLRYNTSGTYGRSEEWNASNAPHHVQISNSTTVDMDNNAAQPTVGGNLTIDSGSTLNMDALASALDVAGDIEVDGTLTLSSAVGGDMEVAGDFNLDGTFTNSSRQVTFDGGAAQAISGTQDIAFAFLQISNSSGGVSISRATTVSDRLTLTSGTLTPSGNLTLTSTSESDFAFIDASGTGTVSGDVTAQRFLTGTANAPSGHWRFIGSPFAANYSGSAGDLFQVLWTQTNGGSGGDENSGGTANNVFTYNEGQDITTALSEGWTAVTNLNGTSNARGTGALVFVFADDTGTGDGAQDNWPKTLSASGSVDATENDGNAFDFTSVTFTNNDVTAQDGWNLVSNPFFAPIDWDAASGWTRTNIDATYYVYDADNNEYETFNHTTNTGTNGGVQNIAPFQAFFVKANAASPDLQATDAVKITSDVTLLKGDTETIPRLKLALVGDAGDEETIFAFTDSGMLGRDAGDAYQLAWPRSEAGMLSSQIAGEEAAFEIQNLPPPQDRLTLDLNVEANSGTFSLEAVELLDWPEGWTATLIDTETTATAELTLGETLTFTLSEATWADDSEAPTKDGVLDRMQVADAQATSRFQLVFDPAGSTATEAGATLPTRVTLDAAYPNPFNPQTTLRFALPEAGTVHLAVYDLLGREVALLVDGVQPTGWQEVTWQASDQASGVYLVRLVSGTQVQTQRVVLLK